MDHSFDLITYCPVCKEDTPHDFRNMLGNVCKICGVVRLADCDGAFKKCRCGEFIPAKPSMVFDVEADQMIVIPPPAHICKCK